MPVTKVREGSSSFPSHVAAGELHQLAAAVDRPLQHDDRIDADQMAVLVGIARAGAGAPDADAAEHRAGVAAHDPLALGRAEFLRARFDGESGHAGMATPALSPCEGEGGCGAAG